MFLKNDKNKSYYLIRRMTLLQEEHYEYAVIDTYMNINENVSYESKYRIYIKIDTSKLAKYHLERLQEQYKVGKGIEDIIEDKDSVILVVPINPEFWNDVDKFWNGEYSNYSKQAKDMLLRGITEYRHTVQSGPDQKARHGLYSVLYPGNEERKLIEDRFDVRLPDHFEVLSKPNPEEETLTLTSKFIIQ